ncbi:MAG: aminoacyl-tRNA hydrolase [Spirochaetaceae bacterium]|jgi:ribosome-associated protein|nr:aminoacyl-tRNA hydrolase [Spirochaetaceae bacterium]
MDRAALHESVLRETRFSFARSGGNGGQNVNKVNTKVYAAVSLFALHGLSPHELALVKDRLAGRINQEGELYLSSDAERSQERNRADALNRLEQLIAAAAVVPKKRRKTEPTRTSKEKRLLGKKLRSSVKAFRRFSGFHEE